MILAFDPGGATGWARITQSQTVVNSGTLWEPEHHASIRQLIAQYEPDLVITESFEFRNASGRSRSGLELISREYIGVMKLICEDFEIPLVQQMPAHALRFIDDKKLAKLGYLRTPVHDCRHENDALRHLFFYLTSKKKEAKWLGKLKQSSVSPSSDG